MTPLLVVLLLQPVLAEDGPVRLAATGVGDEYVLWTLDGAEVARTGDRTAAVIQVPAGQHELRASSAAQGRWQAVARPDGPAQGAAFVPAWTAVHEAQASAPQQGHARGEPPALPIALGLAAAVLLAWPRRRGLQARRRARR